MLHKYTTGFAALAFLSIAAYGQTDFSVLDVNNVSARFYSNGFIGKDKATNQPGYFVPRIGTSMPSPLYTGSLWIGGLDADGNLHFAGERFEQIGLDFFAGPLGTNASITAATSQAYDHVWKVVRQDVERQVAYFNCLADPNCDELSEFPGYVIPSYFYEWPANGDVSEGQAGQLSDFYDYNQDGVYDPDDGDAPCVPGDMALNCIYNDKLNPHTESGGQPIGVEIHMTPFAYSSNDPALNSTVFIRYRIYNRSSLTLHNAYIGLFNDFDLGCGMDDYLQCDVGRNLVLVRNGTNNDPGCNGLLGYGLQPPAFGQMVLKGPLMDADGTDNIGTGTPEGFNGTGFNDGIADNERLGLGHFIYFSNVLGSMGDPETAAEYYGYLKGQWINGIPLTYGGTGYSTDAAAVPARFAYPGNSDPLGVGTGWQVMPPWTEAGAGNPPGDRRGVASMGPFTLEPGSMQEILVAYVYGRAASGGPAASAALVQAIADTIRNFAQTMPGLLAPGASCDYLQTVGVAENGAMGQALRLFPNPATDRLELEGPGPGAIAEVQVMDMTGRTVIDRQLAGPRASLDVASLAPGLYAVQWRGGSTVRTARFVKR
jgi:hypothetical protein